MVGAILISFGMFSFIQTILYWINYKLCYLSNIEASGYSDRFSYVYHYTGILYWINYKLCHLSNSERWVSSDRFWYVFLYTDSPILDKSQTMPFKQL